MLIKDTMLEKLNEIKGVTEKFELTDTFETKVNDIVNFIGEYKSRIVFVGKFSAGKSALLNKLMESDILAENQGPETAIATELVYGAGTSMRLIDMDGHEKFVDAYEVNDMDLGKYMYAVCSIDNAFLQDNSDIVLVDMPGFDSSLERHNKAILQYIDKASAYVLVVDVEDGTLQESAINFIKEIKQYHSNLAIVLTKCDKRTPEDIEQVECLIKELAEDIFEEPVPVACVSKFDDDTATKVLELIQNIDMQCVFEEKFNLLIDDLKDELVICLKTLLTGSSCSQDEIEKVAKQLRYEKQRAVFTIDKEKGKLHRELFNTALPKVLEDLRAVLNCHADELTEVAITSNELFSRKINDYIRPVLLESIKKNAEKSFADFIDSAEFYEFQAIDGDAITDTVREIFNRFSEIMRKYKPEEGADELIKDKKDQVKGILSILAITTDVVAPWVEVIIVFLPDIINFISDYMKKKHLQALKEKMQDEIIPEIIEKIRPELEKSFAEIEKSMLQEIIDRVNKALEDKEAAYNLLLNKTEEEKEFLANRAEEIKQNIEALLIL